MSGKLSTESGVQRRQEWVRAVILCSLVKSESGPPGEVCALSREAWGWLTLRGHRLMDPRGAGGKHKEQRGNAGLKKQPAEGPENLVVFLGELPKAPTNYLILQWDSTQYLLGPYTQKLQRVLDLAKIKDPFFLLLLLQVWKGLRKSCCSEPPKRKLRSAPWRPRLQS